MIPPDRGEAAQFIHNRRHDHARVRAETRSVGVNLRQRLGTHDVSHARVGEVVVDNDADTLVGADLAHEDAVASGALVASNRVAPARVRGIGLEVLGLVRRHNSDVLTATEGTNVVRLEVSNSLLDQPRVEVIRRRTDLRDGRRGSVIVSDGRDIESLTSQRVNREASVVADTLRNQRVHRDHRSATEQSRGGDSSTELVHRDRESLAGKRNAVNVNVLKERGDLLCDVINE